MDMNVLAHQLHQMEEDDVEFVDDILYGYVVSTVTCANEKKQNLVFVFCLFY